ncbi:T9SS type A sorting domain-containing protein [Hanstruepera marina]|uniref:T9SS type A sorting domain-containing protein n=1 Tax=Hanstruepera marina TaxID=2873265 RepID=UPI001CA77A5F|nr:spondin domain-containing protein [Hanstruepera marina]
MKTTTSIFLLLALMITNIIYSQSVATYNITFTSSWNSTDHGTLPTNAHWSRLVGANHNNNITFLEMGQLATQGIEDVAELGDNAVFMDVEVQQAINNGNAEQYINGSSLANATGTIEIMGLDVSEDYPLLTLVSMIAPSPDWMIAINGINLRENNSWKNNISIDLYPYDAGTDDGINYTSGNADSNPQGVITSLVNIGPFNDQKIGTLIISLQGVLGVDEFQSESVKLFPNPMTTNFNIASATNNTVTETTIYNVLGKQILEVKNASNTKFQTINVANLKKGVYLVNMKFKNEESVLKKIIIH